MPCLASAKYSGRVPVPSIRLYSKRRIIHVYIDPSVYSVVRGMLPVIIPTSMSRAEGVLDGKGFTISRHAYAYSYQMPRSKSEGLLESFNPLLRATSTSNHRLQLDYSGNLDTSLGSLALLVYYADFAFQFLICYVCLVTVSLLFTADCCVRHVEKCSLVD